MAYFYVYKITNVVTNLSYIGVTRDAIKQRLREHVYAAKHKTSNRKLFRAINEYGPENFQIEVVYEGEESKYAERYFIENEYIIKYDTYDNGYNGNLGGVGLTEHTTESKQKMSANNFWRGKSRTGSLNPMYGRKHTQEAKQMMSEKKIGITTRFNYSHSEKTKQKISLATKGRLGHWKGKTRSIEWCEQMSAQRLGKPNVKKRKSYLITHPDGHQETIHGLVDFCKIHNLNAGNLLTHKKSKGYKLEQTNQ